MGIVHLISIGNKHHKNTGEYIGRGSPLGNPYPITQTESRDFVCDKYEEYLDTQITAKNPSIIKELNRLYNLYQDGPITLLCFCHPKRCHGETIRNVLLEMKGEFKT